MTGVQFLALLRLYTSSNTTNFPNADVVTFANASIEWMCQEAEKVNEGFFAIEQKTDLVAAQRGYTLPVTMMNRLEKVAVKFPDWDKWRLATEVQLAMEPWPMDEDTITNMYTDYEPRFLLRSNEIILLTHSVIPAATDALDLWAKIYPAPWDTTTLSSNIDLSVSPTSISAGIPRQLHELLCRRVAIEWKQTRERPIPLTQKEELFEQDMAKAIKAIAGQNIARSVVARMDDYDPELGYGNWPKFIPFQ